MKKFINGPDQLTAELLEGLALAFPQKVMLAGESIVMRAQAKPAGQVAMVTLGGSGHEPGLSGFVGDGLVDVSVVGGIFSAPGAARVLQGLKLADTGAGVLLVVLNHAGDVLSSGIALEAAEKAGLHVRSVLTHDDISGGAKESEELGRGLVGCVAVYKIAGAAAKAGRQLEEVHALAERMSANTRTLAVAVQEATHPATGKMIGQPDFALSADEMEIGMGQHGEAGTGRMKLQPADATADLMLNQLLNHLDAKRGDRMLVVLNGSGATTYMELLIVFRRVAHALKERGIELARSLVGEFTTTQEQAGFQLMIARMDDELLRLWDAPCDAPYLTVR